MLQQEVCKNNDGPKFETTHNYSFNFQIRDLILDTLERFVVVVGPKFLRFLRTKSGELSSGLNRQDEQIIPFKVAIQKVEHIPPRLKVTLANGDTRAVDYGNLKRIEEFEWVEDLGGFEHEQIRCIVGKPNIIPNGVTVAGNSFKLESPLSFNPVYALVLPRYSVIQDELGNFSVFRREGGLLIPCKKKFTANVWQTAIFRKMTDGYFTNTYDADEKVDGHSFVLFGGKNMLLGRVRE